MKLIKLQDKFILVSDEKPKAGEYSLYNNIKIHLCIEDIVGDKFKKIIAGIPELPEIDFSLLSEEACKTIGFVDVEKLAAKAVICNGGLITTEDETEVAFSYYHLGFKAAQSLNDKMFSLEDMKTAYDNGMSNIDSDGCAIDNCNENFNDIIQSLQQTVWDVEVEMEEYAIGNYGMSDKEPTINERPKITNNSIKIVKIL